MVLIVRAPETYLAERRYVLDVVLGEWLGLAYDLHVDQVSQVEIRVAGDPEAKVLTAPDVLFATPSADWLTERSIPIPPLEHVEPSWRPLAGSPVLPAGGLEPWDRNPIPALFSNSNTAGIAGRASASGIHLNLDIFGSVFFVISGYEERTRRTRDEHDRFPAGASLAAMGGFLERPIVDEYVDLLWDAIRSLWPTAVRRRSSFRLRLTHDVDRPWASLGQRTWVVAHGLAGDLVRRRDPGLALNRALSFLDARRGRVSRDPFNTFDMLMDTSEHHGLQSTFYFMAGDGSNGIDGQYRVSDPEIARLLKRVHDRGHEIGLHSSYESYRSPERIRGEFESLRAACRVAGFDQPTWGVRQHYLRFDNPQTWRGQDAAGFDHDSTLGFAEHIGFRMGTCREYPVFDLLARRALKLRERPLLVMDATFWYMDVGPEEAALRTRAVVDRCRYHGGDAVLLVHNSSLLGARRRAQYAALVAAIAGDG